MKVVLFALAVAAAVAGHEQNAAIARRHQGIAARAPAPTPEPEADPGHSVHFNSTHMKRDEFSGHSTWFYTGQGACGGFNNGGDLIVALDQSQYDGGAHCYKFITIHALGKTEVAQIVDECPGCPYGSLDFSTGLFQRFTDLGTGSFPITWSYNDGSAPPPPPPPPPPPKTTKSTAKYTPPPTSSHQTTPSPSPTSKSTTSNKPPSTTHKTSSSTTTSSSTSTSASAAPTGPQNLAQLEQAVFSIAELLNAVVDA